MVQKEKLQEQVVAMVEYDLNTAAIDKLKKLYYLHTDLEGPYYLLYKAIFEIKIVIPTPIRPQCAIEHGSKMKFIVSLEC